MLGYSLWICSHPILRRKGGEAPTELHLQMCSDRTTCVLPICVSAYGTGFCGQEVLSLISFVVPQKPIQIAHICIFCILWLILCRASRK